MYIDTTILINLPMIILNTGIVLIYLGKLKNRVSAK